MTRLGVCLVLLGLGTLAPTLVGQSFSSALGGRVRQL